jgi:hypothetical protein
MTVHRIASRLEKLERRSVTGSRRYWLHFDEVEEMARHDANGWPYAVGPRVLESDEEWERIYGGEQCNAH